MQNVDSKGQVLDLSEQERVRREKLELIKKAGIQAYPERFELTHELHEARALADGTPGVSVAGRIKICKASSSSA
jgi:lysyl-tRNA synthetase class II